MYFHTLFVMGVPGLFPFICQRFPKTITHFLKEGKNARKYDYVYLDANGLLHKAAQIVENYGAMKRMMNPYSDLNKAQKRHKIFDLFFENIIDIITIVQPTKVLYIALDGPAPRAKQAQQRQRRFVAALQNASAGENKDQTASLDNDVFSSSEITPGTKFMHELNKYMHYRIRKFLMSNKKYGNLHVMYSPPSVAGEGEHKIMDYMRQLPEHDKKDASHCMFGPDGDLLMLTLTAPVRRIVLFREDIQNDGEVDLMDMGQVRLGLASELKQYKAIQSNTRTLADVVNDFVLLGFLVGNDFLPRIKMFFKLADGLEKMFEIVVKMRVENNLFLTSNGKISIQGLLKFFGILHGQEARYIAQQATLQVSDPMFTDHTLIKHCKMETRTRPYPTQSQPQPTNSGTSKTVKPWQKQTDVNVGEPVPVVLETDKIVEETYQHAFLDVGSYRRDYYIKAGISDSNNSNKTVDGQISDMCKDYIRNIGWVYQYYVMGLPSWCDAYTWHYPPLMSDLNRYLKTLSQQTLDSLTSFPIKSNPALPFEQLLSVLPASQSKLLPKHYRELMVSETSPLSHYYPKQFHIDYEGKYKEYQGIAILPFVDYKTVSTAYKIRENSCKYAYNKNVLESGAYEFRLMGKKSVQFESEYGDIHECNVGCLQV